MPQWHAGQGNYSLHSCGKTSKFGFRDLLKHLKPHQPHIGHRTIFALAVVVGSYVSFKVFERMLSRAIEAAIETFDRNLIGIDIEMDTLLLHLDEMALEIRGLHVLNPDGFDSEYLLYAKRVLVDLHGWEFFSSWGKAVIIENLHFLDVHMNVESHGSKSNLALVMEGKDAINDHNWHLRHPSEPRVTKCVTEKKKKRIQKRAGGKPSSDDESKFRLQNVDFKDITISYSSKTMSCDVNVTDISYGDFSKEVGTHFADDIIAVIMKTLGKTVTKRLHSSMSTYLQPIYSRVSDCLQTHLH